MIAFVKVLFSMKLLSPAGLWHLCLTVVKEGVNLMLLLRLSARFHGGRIALVDDQETLSYEQLHDHSLQLAHSFSEKYSVKSGQKIGFLCDNHASFVAAVFAASRLGAHVYLLNTDMSKNQVDQFAARFRFDLLIYDARWHDSIQHSAHIPNKLLSEHDRLPSVLTLLKTPRQTGKKLARASAGSIVLLTGGTTGVPKKAVHRPSLFQFLNPFLALIDRLHLSNCQTAFVATPLFHGYGFAVLFAFFGLGKKIVISRRFHAPTACRLIRGHHVDVVTVVPLMIYKMLAHGAGDLTSLSCIASGGAPLSPKLVEAVSKELGAVLYNLYGTSEAGLNTIATPQDLAHSPHTIGRKISGVRFAVRDGAKRSGAPGIVGPFCIQNSWSAGRSRSWVETGDVGCRDANGYYFLKGRVDDMIVSAGENVYPLDVEQVLSGHPVIECAAVVGIKDELFGQRLAAFVQPAPGAAITEEALSEWLRPRVARFQLPREIVLVEEMPYTPLGKLDKKQLKKRYTARGRE